MTTNYDCGRCDMRESGTDCCLECKYLAMCQDHGAGCVHLLTCPYAQRYRRGNNNE